VNPSSITVIHLIAQLRYGAGRYVADMAIEQARSLKYNVQVCVSTDADEYWRTDPILAEELAGRGIEVRTIGDFFHRRADKLHQCAAHLRELKGKAGGQFIVHAHTAMAAATGYWASPDALIATCHGWGSGRPPDIDLQDSLAYQLCDSVITYSNHWADRLRSELAVSDPKVVPMGICLNRFSPIDKESHRDSGPLRIVTVCELTARKGVDVLLDSMPLLWSRMPDTELHIIGYGDAADDLKIQAAAIDPGMKRIFFHGAVPNAYAHLSDYDLFVLPSRSDNLPIALLEAMLAGLPIVATSVGGIPELLSAARCGTVVRPESPEELAQSLIVAAAGGRRSMASAGANGERYVRERLDVRQTARDHECIYLDALKKRGRVAHVS